MRVLVLCGSKYGSTRDIARYMAERLHEAGLEVNVGSATYAGRLDIYDALVIGSAVYMGSWLKEPAEWVRRHAPALRERPVWLFSSGPLGDNKLDGQGKDLREISVPKEVLEFERLIKPRGHRVFFGALDHNQFGFAHRMLWNLHAAVSC